MKGVRMPIDRMKRKGSAREREEGEVVWEIEI